MDKFLERHKLLKQSPKKKKKKNILEDPRQERRLNWKSKNFPNTKALTDMTSGKFHQMFKELA